MQTCGKMKKNEKTIFCWTRRKCIHRFCITTKGCSHTKRFSSLIISRQDYNTLFFAHIVQTHPFLGRFYRPFPIHQKRRKEWERTIQWSRKKENSEQVWRILVTHQAPTLAFQFCFWSDLALSALFVFFWSGRTNVRTLRVKLILDHLLGRGLVGLRHYLVCGKGPKRNKEFGKKE